MRRIGSGLVHTPQKSSALISSTRATLTDIPTVTTIDATWERVIYEEPVNPLFAPKFFGRVEVVIPY